MEERSRSGERLGFLFRPFERFESRLRRLHLHFRKEHPPFREPAQVTGGGGPIRLTPPMYLVSEKNRARSLLPWASHGCILSNNVTTSGSWKRGRTFFQLNQPPGRTGVRKVGEKGRSSIVV